MRRSLLLLLLCASTAQAGDLSGTWSVSGTFTTPTGTVTTSATITATTRNGHLRLERVGRYTSAANQHLAPFEWSCGQATRLGPGRYRAIYQLGGGITGNLTGQGADVLVADYVVHGNTVAETIANTIQRRPHHWWSSLQTSGLRTSTGSSGTVYTTREVYTSSGVGSTTTTVIQSGQTAVVMGGATVIRRTQTFHSGPNTTITLSSERVVAGGGWHEWPSSHSTQHHTQHQSGVTITFGIGNSQRFSTRGRKIGSWHHHDDGLPGQPRILRHKR